MCKYIGEPGSQFRPVSNSYVAPTSSVQLPLRDMASRLFQVHSPARLTKLEVQSDPRTPSKMQGQQLRISEFLAADPESPPSSTKQRRYSKRGTKDTCMGMRPPLGIVKYAEFTKDSGSQMVVCTLLQTRSRGKPRCFEIYAWGQGSRPLVHNILVFCWPEWHHSGLRNVSDCGSKQLRMSCRQHLQCH